MSSIKYYKAFEKKYKVKLPEELMNFYRAADGHDWHNYKPLSHGLENTYLFAPLHVNDILFFELFYREDKPEGMPVQQIINDELNKPGDADLLFVIGFTMPEKHYFALVYRKKKYAGAWLLDADHLPVKHITDDLSDLVKIRYDDDIGTFIQATIQMYQEGNPLAQDVLNDTVLLYTPYKTYREVLVPGEYNLFDSDSIHDTSFFPELVNLLKQYPFSHCPLVVESVKVEDKRITISGNIQGKPVEFTHTVTMRDAIHSRESFFNILNELLNKEGVKDRSFINFEAPNFGDEIGIAFLSPGRLQEFISLSNCRVSE